MHGKKTKKDKTRLPMSPFPEKETFILSCFGNEQSGYPIPSLFNPQLKISGSDSHFKANLTSGQISPTFRCNNSPTQHMAQRLHAASNATCLTCLLLWRSGSLSWSTRAGHASGPHLRIASVYIEFCSASRGKKAIQAHRFPAYNQIEKAMGHKASLPQLHPEPFAMVLLVLFTTDLL